MTNGEPLIRPEWVVDHIGEIGERLGEHILLTLIAVVVGAVLSFGLSLWALRQPSAYGPVTWAAGVLYTVPSLALFALLVPITGLSVLTAEIGLVSYTLLILIRAIVGGVRGVPADVREAAEGLGYTSRALLWQIELPLALPVIVAGLRVAVVTTIGLVTVSALIGQGGVGYFILQGVQRLFSTALIVGAVLSVALAVLADGTLVMLQRRLTPWLQAER
jgi:osmoprotectant transport system permease protein